MEEKPTAEQSRRIAEDYRSRGREVGTKNALAAIHYRSERGYTHNWMRLFPSAVSDLRALGYHCVGGFGHYLVFW